jgi:hypothetical protein
VLAAVCLALLAASCGGGPSAGPAASSKAGGSTSSDELAFSRCMRANGVGDYPDPSSGGTIPKRSAQELGVSATRYQAAQRECAHLLPNGGRGPDQAQLQQIRAKGLQFAQCMRHHGVALPDPARTGRIPDPASVGINQGSPQFESANQACGRYRPPYMPSNAQYNAYARSHGT